MGDKVFSINISSCPIHFLKCLLVFPNIRLRVMIWSSLEIGIRVRGLIWVSLLHNNKNKNINKVKGKL